MTIELKTPDLPKGEQLENWKKKAKTLILFALPCVLLFGAVWLYGGINASKYALGHANLSRDQVSFIRFSLDIDDFIPTYEVSWYQGNHEADYTVHAVTGQLLEYDWD